MKKDIKSNTTITKEQLLQHWQGHRNLTRRVIEAFPEDKLFDYSIGGMRPFAEMTMEVIQIGAPGIKGIATGEWEKFGELADTNLKTPETKQELLNLWDWSTEQINQYWKKIPVDRLQEKEEIFGQWEGQIWWHLLYFIDNEVHHRGQGYVYLRSLEIEPPHFWER